MPDGRLQRIDAAKETAHIVRRGREFIASLSDVEPRARVPGARVHFDISRRDGQERATRVSLASGTRTNRGQRRFGDLAGSRQPGAKVKTTGASLLGVGVSTQPVQVVQAWVEAGIEGATDAAAALYSPDAVIHTPDETITGRRHILAFLENHSPRHFDLASVAVVGEDQLVRADYPPAVNPADNDEISGPSSCWFAVDHGRIVEQWHVTEPDLELAEPVANGEIDIVINGPVAPEQIELAYDRMRHLTSAIDRHVQLARMKLSVIEHPTKMPVSGSASVDVDGTVLRAQVGAREVSEAIDTLCLRLRAQVADRISNHREKNPSAGKYTSWHHGDPPTERPGFYARAPEDRSIVRHKSFTTTLASVEEAVWDMQALDYDFFLFTDADTGHDCLLSRTPNGFALQQMDHSDPKPQTDLIDLVIEHSTPNLSVDEAIARLDHGIANFVFFRNIHTDRGNVLYLRYDGHYGLITPAGG